MSLLKRIYILLAVLALAGCANRGVGPQGGPKDSIPPIPVRSVPENGSVLFDGKRIEVLFNEYIQLENIGQNLMMSPPMQNPPDVKARGKRLLVVFKDSLRDSTTYTIDFGDAVCDFTERNPLHGYAFAFSTGDIIDTIEMRGRVYSAENLNPVAGISAGIHSDLSDAAFTSSTFLRMAKTDSAGYFRIGNMRAGTYRLYAVDDISRDYRLTQGEAFGFAEDLFTTDSAGLATLQPIFLFSPQQKRLYLQRTLRDKRHLIQLFFSSSPDSVPSFRPLPPSVLNSAANDSAWIDPTPYMHLSFSAHRDTVTLWLTDSLAITQDTLSFAVRYRQTDSLYRLEWREDTIRTVWRAPRMSAKAREDLERQNRNRRLELKTNARKGFEIYDTLFLSSSTPLASIAVDSIHLIDKGSVAPKEIPFSIVPHDTLPMRLQIIANLKPGGDYELRLDSGTLHDVYGITHVAANYAMQVKQLSDYSTLRVKITPFNPRARIQLLSGKDQVILDFPAAEEGTLFEYLKPDGYYLRLYLDENGDGQWTTGSWEPKRQPEKVYYFPEKIQTKSNWDFEEEWDYMAIPQTEAKPKELLKVGGKTK